MQDLTIVMYHYIGPTADIKYPGIKSLEYQDPSGPLYGGYGGIAVTWKNKAQAMKSIEAAMKKAKVKELDDIDIRRNPGV